MTEQKDVSGNMTAESTFVPSVSYVIQTTSKSLECAENHKQTAGPINISYTDASIRQPIEGWGDSHRAAKANE